MKKLLALIVGLVMMSSLALAQLDPDPNSMGVYFDTDATVVHASTAVPFERVTAYLVVANPTSAGIAGWECKVDVAGPSVALQWSYAGGGLNVYNPDAGLFNVGVGLTPNALLPVNNVCVLATWTAFIMNPFDVVTFTVMPFPGSVTFSNAPGYVDGDNVTIVVPCDVSTGYPYGTYCAMINGVNDVVDNETTTWGGVKALYR